MNETAPVEPSEPSIPDGVRFHRPRWMIQANLVAAILFIVAGCATFLAGRLFIPIVWWVFGVFWIRRYRWAQDSPFLVLNDTHLVLFVGDRQQSLPWTDVEGMDLEEKKITLQLKDGSKLSFSASDLAENEFPRFSETLQSHL